MPSLNFYGADELNLLKERNYFNTKMRLYNCGGFALKTFSWYMPYLSNSKSFENFVNNSMNIVYASNGRNEPIIKEELLNNGNIFVDSCAEVMVEEFNGRLRIIKDKNDSKKDELVICFRVETAGSNDFHFMQYRASTNSWAHKRGNSPRIEVIRDRNLLYPWAGRYDSKITYLALKMWD